MPITSADFLESFIDQLRKELFIILNFWQQRMPDLQQGGFHGAMTHEGVVVSQAPKGVVLNARILWTFSEAAIFTGELRLRETANYAYKYFSKTFFDAEFGGVYWSVDVEGNPLETKKQIYAQSFSIYALAAYYKLTGDEKVLKQALHLYELIESHSRDTQQGGYYEAFSREWGELGDLRLSDKDANEKKTMNTHLHVLEAYTYLYRVWPNDKLKNDILSLLEIFDSRILDHNTQSQGLFFTESWQRKDTLVSYGHDIESSWLLQEAADVIGEESWKKRTREISVDMARAALRGIDVDGGMWHEYNYVTLHLVREKHWWPQAESLVGFYNAWQNAGDPVFLEQVYASWKFIQEYIIDKRVGEWRWGVYEDHSYMDTEDLAGFWKCPYHNGRACLELLHRLGSVS